MGYPGSPGHVAAGPAASTWANKVSDDLDYLANSSNQHPYCHAYLNGVQTPGAGAATTVALDTEVKRVDITRVGGVFTINTAGLYLVVAGAAYPSTATGADKVAVLQNGAGGIATQVPFISATHRLIGTGLIQCAVADTLTLQTTSGSGGTLGTGQFSTFMQVLWQML